MTVPTQEQPDRRMVLKAGFALASAMMLPGGTAFAQAPAPPPAKTNAAGPWAYWYWLDANITREGIVADLDAMQAAGIVGVYIFNVGGKNAATRLAAPVETMTAAWWDLARFAVERAGGYGMTVAMNICDGWGTAGGRWITPDRSMQELVWTETLIESGQAAILPQPTTRHEYYRDIAAFAFPVPPDWDRVSDGAAHITASWPVDGLEKIGDPRGAKTVITTDKPGWLQFAFDAPFTLRSVTVRTPTIAILPFLSVGYNGAANSFAIEVSDDGLRFRRVHVMVPPQLGWQSNPTTLTHSIPPTTARHFRFLYDPQAVRLHNHDGEFEVSRKLSLASMTLSSRPVIDQLPVKSGGVWGIGRPMNGVLLPTADCIAMNGIIDVSGRCKPDGTLDWKAPKGRWAVVRIGATSTGKETEPSGLGGGLECDKFDPETVKIQFDGWFGEALRQMGPALAGKVLKVFHIDSWESRTQTWSPVFAAAFKARRGYALEPHLLAMTGIPIKSAEHSERVLFDVRRTIADLLADNFFGTLETLAHEKDCLFSAQAVNASFPSEGMQHHRHVDLPCGEFWMNRPGSDKPSDVREAVSASRIYGKPLATAEAWTGGLNWSEHPFSFKRQGDQNFAYGINRLVFHVWALQAFPKERKPGVTLFGLGSFFSENQPWWPMAGGWIDYLTRCQTLLQQGVAVVDILYFTGEDIPSRAFRPDRLVPPLPPGFSYDSVNPDALLSLAEVMEGRIRFPGGASYAVLVLPPDTRMTLKMLRKIDTLIASGATVVGPRPTTSPTLADDEAAVAEARAIIARLWSGTGKGIRAGDLATVAGAPDVTAPAEILWVHKRIGQQDIYFLSNQSDHPIAFRAGFRATARVALYDPVSDRSTLPSAIRQGARTHVPITLAPSGSIFVVFDDAYPMRPAQVTPGTEFILHNDALFAEAATPFAPIPLRGPWTAHFDIRGKSRRITMPQLRSWTDFDDPDIRFHSGLVRYRTRIALRLPAGMRWRLQPDSFADVIRVIVNGKEMGVLWVPGTSLDVTDSLKAGTNQIELFVANTWRNRLVGDAGKSDADRETWILPNRLGALKAAPPGADATLLPAGLLGPVRLVPFVRQTL